MKLNFLLNHENTQYKLAKHPVDLTATQVHFLYTCAMMQEEKLSEIQGGTGVANAQPRTPLDINADSSREEIDNVFDIITEHFC